MLVLIIPLMSIQFIQQRLWAFWMYHFANIEEKNHLHDICSQYNPACHDLQEAAGTQLDEEEETKAKKSVDNIYCQNN